jgi:hypothetical protein
LSGCSFCSDSDANSAAGSFEPAAKLFAGRYSPKTRHLAGENASGNWLIYRKLFAQVA